MVNVIRNNCERYVTTLTMIIINATDQRTKIALIAYWIPLLFVEKMVIEQENDMINNNSPKSVRFDKLWVIRHSS